MNFVDNFQMNLVTLSLNLNCFLNIFLEIYKCYQNHTFSREEIFDDTFKNLLFHDIEGLEDIGLDEYWNDTTHIIYFGRCQTFMYPKEVGANSMTDSFFFSLKTHLNYQVYFHDSSYYYLATNPSIFPRIFINFQVKFLDDSI